MKILFINLFEGCKEPNRMKAAINFIKKINADVVGLSELNDWDKLNFKKLNFFKNKTSLKHHLFAKSSSGYHLGLFSKTPLLDSEIITNGFNTGLITAKNKDIYIALTHLHHLNEDLRLKELDIIFSKIKKNQNSLLMGDLNSLSKKDGYDDIKLLKQMSALKISKFGKNSVRYDAITKIEEEGFVDCVFKKNNKIQYSVPTNFNQDLKHFSKLRLDYIFTSKNLYKKIKSAKIIRNNETTKISDHFPVMIEVKN